MLSICIPVYNLKMHELTHQLAQQCQLAGIEFEIVLADDGSQEDFKLENRELQQFTFVNYFEMPHNVGRSVIRNVLADAAKYDYRLFIDCDSLVPNTQLIANYVKNIQAGHKVVCGGSVYQREKPPLNQQLRWRYGNRVESNMRRQRALNAAKSFMTNNFLIHKSVMQTVRFNETLSTYGHEDTLFGYDLKKAGILPLHTNNPVLNCHLDTNRVFLDKTGQAIRNLLFIVSKIDQPALFISEVTLLQTYFKLPLKPLFRLVFVVLNPILRMMLRVGITNLTLFNVYKLGLMVQMAPNILKK